MEPPEPENGLVIRYDFLWKAEHDKGQNYGLKDRLCAIVLTSKAREDGSRQVVVCPITHTSPEDRSRAIEVPVKVAAHLRLDGQRSWIRTYEVTHSLGRRGAFPLA